MDLNQYDTDKNLELNGVWLKPDATTSLLIARNNNQNYLNELNKIIAENGMTVAARGGKIPPETMIGFVKKAASRTILLGWEGLTKNKKPIKYSHEEAEAQFIKYPEFFALVLNLSSETEHFLAKVEEDIIKN